jgi:hypothetical protein
LDPGLKKLRDSELADEVGALQHRVDTIKIELICRKIRHATGAHFRLVLTPPGVSQRSDRALLLATLGITAGESTLPLRNRSLSCSVTRRTPPPAGSMPHAQFASLQPKHEQ